MTENQSITFDYVKYDDDSLYRQTVLKDYFMEIESFIKQRLAAGRARSLALTKLEEAYAWCGKAIRDDQIAREGGAKAQDTTINKGPYT